MPNQTLPSFMEMCAALDRIWANSRLARWRTWVLVIAGGIAMLLAGLAVRSNVNHGEISITFLFAVGIVFLVVWLLPYLFNQTPNNPADSRPYFLLLGNVEIWAAIFFGSLHILTFEKNPKALSAILAASVIVPLGTTCWGYGSSWIRRVIYYAYLVVGVIAVAVAVSNTFSPAIFGRSIFQTPTDKNIVEVREIIREQKELRRLAALRRAGEKIKNGLDNTLSPEEREAWEQDTNSLWGKILSLIGSGKAHAKAKPEPPVASHYAPSPPAPPAPVAVAPSVPTVVTVFMPAAPVPASPPTINPGKYMLSWERDPEDRTGTHPHIRSGSFLADVKFEDDKLVIREHYSPASFIVFKCPKTEDGKCEGTWKQQIPAGGGDFGIDDISTNALVGWWRSDGSPYKTRMWLKKW